MTPKFVNFEIILIYFLLLIPWPHSHVMKLLCSKDSSRLVRKIVRSKWTPILDKYQVKLPLECPLHPFRDVFAPRQDAKKRDRPTQWTCRLCGKSFYKEKFLDLHFETRHKSIRNDAEDAVCLADFCDIMRCEVFQTEESSSLKTGDQHIITDIEVWGDSLGQNSALAKANAAYLSLIPIRTSSTGATRAAKVQNRQLCQDKIGQNKFKDTVDNLKTADFKSKTSNDPSMKKPGTTTDSQTANNAKTAKQSGKQSTNSKTPKNESNDEDELNSDNANNTENDNKTQNGNLNHMQRMRANCKAEELNKLKARCELLVRSCIASLFLSMSDQSFKEMEEEMNKAVCWYLSCDRYWEDGPLEPRAFPWGLLWIFVFVVSTGICFCYYIIWILFDSEETTISVNQHTYMHPQHYPQQQYHPHPTEQLYYYQQQAQHPSAGAHDLYPEQPQYDYRHSPRRYIGDQRPRQSVVGGGGTPTAAPTTSIGAHQTSATATPLHHQHHHHTNLAYQQDILDRRDYTSSRPIATTAVSGVGGGSSSSIGPNISATAGAASHAASASNIMDGVVDANAMGALGGGGGSGGGGGGVGGKHYNTHPRPLGAHHRHAGSSQQSLRGSSSSHEIIQNEIGHNEHYIYVTYPPDLKKRFFEKYE